MVSIILILGVRTIVITDFDSTRIVIVHTKVEEIWGTVKNVSFDGYQYQVKEFLGKILKRTGSSDFTLKWL